MADEADKSFDTYQMHVEGCLREHSVAMSKVQEIEGKGECDICEEYYSRLVQRTIGLDTFMCCARCRDRLKLG